MSTTNTQLFEIAERIKEMREILGYSVTEMAAATEVTVSEYIAYESGEADLPFTFIHKCALAFGIEITELLEGSSDVKKDALELARVIRPLKKKALPFRILRLSSRASSLSPTGLNMSIQASFKMLPFI